MFRLIPFNRRESGLMNRNIDEWHNDLEEFFDERRPWRHRLARGTFKLDVQEKDSEYHIEADLPGVKKEEIKVDLDDGMLTISVEREEKIDEEKKNYVHRERRYRSMQRSIYLANAKAEGIKAKLDAGVLNISVPKEAKQDSSVKIDIE